MASVDLERLRRLRWPQYPSRLRRIVLQTASPIRARLHRSPVGAMCPAEQSIRTARTACVQPGPCRPPPLPATDRALPPPAAPPWPHRAACPEVLAAGARCGDGSGWRSGTGKPRPPGLDVARLDTPVGDGHQAVPQAGVLVLRGLPRLGPDSVAALIELCETGLSTLDRARFYSVLSSKVLPD